MQMRGLLRGEIGTGGDFCGLVVDLAIKSANIVVLALLNAAQKIGLEAIALTNQGFLLAADSACTAAYRGLQQLLDGEVASLNSSLTIDLSAAAAEHPSGTPPLHL
jgi:hypothetical protein